MASKVKKPVKATGKPSAKASGKAKAPAKVQAKPAPVPVEAAAAEPAGEGGAPGYAEAMEAVRREHGLSEREARFALEFIVDGNASAAYLRAGYSAKQANASAARLAAKASIKAAIAHLRAKREERIGFTADDTLAMTADILRADHRELIEFKVGCCRFCYGDQHMYQRTVGEMARDRAKHEAQVARRQERNKEYEDPGFDEQGGDGFDIRRDPNTECPVCGGDGAGRVVIKDTRHISKAAAALFAGIKEGKDGIEVKFHDKAVMLEKMFKHHGLYEKDNKQQAAQIATPEVLRELHEAMERSRERRRQEMKDRAAKGFTGD